MEPIPISNLNEIRKAKKVLENKFKAKIEIKNKEAIVTSLPINEYEISLVLEAIIFGFSARTALLLLDPDITFKKVNIKDFTRRKNLRDVRARIIGTQGKTKNTLEKITDCSIIIKENIVGVLGETEEVEKAIVAIQNIVKGSKQSNAYKYIEKLSKNKPEGDLGLK